MANIEPGSGGVDSPRLDSPSISRFRTDLPKRTTMILPHSSKEKMKGNIFLKGIFIGAGLSKFALETPQVQWYAIDDGCVTARDRMNGDEGLEVALKSGDKAPRVYRSEVNLKVKGEFLQDLKEYLLDIRKINFRLEDRKSKAKGKRLPSAGSL